MKKEGAKMDIDEKKMFKGFIKFTEGYEVYKQQLRHEYYTREKLFDLLKKKELVDMDVSFFPMFRNFFHTGTILTLQELFAIGVYDMKKLEAILENIFQEYLGEVIIIDKYSNNPRNNLTDYEPEDTSQDYNGPFTKKDYNGPLTKIENFIAPYIQKKTMGYLYRLFSDSTMLMTDVAKEEKDRIAKYSTQGNSCITDAAELYNFDKVHKTGLLVQGVIVELNEIAREVEKIDLIIKILSEDHGDYKEPYGFDVFMDLKKIKSFAKILNCFDHYEGIYGKKGKKRFKKTLLKIYRLYAIYLMTDVGQYLFGVPLALGFDNFSSKMRKLYAEVVCEGKVNETALLKNNLFFRAWVIAELPKDQYSDSSKKPFILMYLLNLPSSEQDLIIDRMKWRLKDELNAWEDVEIIHRYKLPKGEDQEKYIPYDDEFATDYLGALKRIFLVD